MSSLWHRIGLYFGVGDETAEDRRLRQARPTRSVARAVLGCVTAALVVGALFAIVDGDLLAGVIFGVVLAVAFTAQDIWRRREQS